MKKTLSNQKSGLTAAANLYRSGKLLLMTVLMISSGVAFSQVIKANYDGTTVNMNVSGCVYTNDPGGQNFIDPFPGALIYYISNGQDGSASRAMVCEGTHNWNTIPQTLTFTSNSLTNYVYLTTLAFDSVYPPADFYGPHGKYEVTLNNDTIEVDSTVIRNFRPSWIKRALKIPYQESPVDIEVWGNIHTTDIDSMHWDILPGLVVCGISNEQDGSASFAKIFEGTHPWKSTIDTFSFTSNVFTDSLYVFALHDTCTDALHPYEGSYYIKVNNVTYQISDQRIIHLLCDTCDNWYSTNDNLSITIGNISGCEGSNSIPVTTSNFLNVTSISLCIQYTEDNATFDTIVNLHPSFSQGFFDYGHLGNQIIISMFSLTPISILNGKLFDLKFNFTGNCQLSWNNNVPYGEIRDNFDNIIPTTFINGQFEKIDCRTLSGSVKYCNVVASPMNNTLISLSKDGEIISQIYSDANGFFSFSNLQDGSYSIICSTSKPTGGINSSDALLALKHFVQMVTLSGCSLLAGDADGNGIINSIDALMIQKKFVGYFPSFPIGDWLWYMDSNPIMLTSDTTIEISAVCTGDVNCSYLPTLKTESLISLNQSDTWIPYSKDIIQLPITTNINLNMNSLSLTLHLPSNLFEVIDIISPFEKNFLWNVRNEEIIIAWYDTHIHEIAQGHDLITLIIQPTDPANIRDITLTVNPTSEITNLDLTPLPADLSFPKIINLTQPLRCMVYPNPTNGALSVDVDINEPAAFTIEIMDMLGRIIHTPLKNKTLHSGSNHFDLSLEHLPKGTYFYKTSTSSGNNTNMKRDVIIIN